MAINVFLNQGTTLARTDQANTAAPFAPDANGWVGVPSAALIRNQVDAGNAWLIERAIPCTTAGRPTANLLPGMHLFDSTLGKPIWRNAANSGWVDATGVAV